MQYIPYMVPVSVKGIVVEDGGVWLRSNERSEWELPGGKIDPGEQPIETVTREMREELGYSVSVIDLVSAYMYTVENSIDESSGVLVLTYACSVNARIGDFEYDGEAGRAEFKLFPLAEVDTLNMPLFYKEAIAKASRLMH